MFFPSHCLYSINHSLLTFNFYLLPFYNNPLFHFGPFYALFLSLKYSEWADILFSYFYRYIYFYFNRCPHHHSSVLNQHLGPTGVRRFFWDSKKYVLTRSRCTRAKNNDEKEKKKHQGHFGNVLLYIMKIYTSPFLGFLSSST